MQILVDNRLRLPADAPDTFIRALQDATTHKNPDFMKAKQLGLWTGNIASKISTWRKDENGFSLPRGTTQLIRHVARSMGISLCWSDNRVRSPVAWPTFLATPRDYQEDGIEQCCKKEQGIVRAPTGCLAGSTTVLVHRRWSFRLEISELVRRLRGGQTGGYRWRQDQETKVWARYSSGCLALVDLLDAYESGVKQTYTLQLSNGLSIRATLDHRFLTTAGWLQLRDLRAGDLVEVAGEHLLERTKFSEVVSVRPFGEEMTYDLSCDAPNNFVANGMIVHNSGKTLMALAALPRLGERSLVIVRDSHLLDQWVTRAQENFGFSKKEIGILASGKRRIGEQLTVALQQTLYSKAFPLADYVNRFGAVIVDEVHDAAARTVSETVDAFPGRARLGFSADHSRRDRKEFLIEELFGQIIFSVDKKSLEQTRAVVPVVVRLVPTDFNAKWYVDSPSEERDFTRLITEMVSNDERCRLVRRVVRELVDAAVTPTLVFTHRREHAQRLAELELPADGVPTGLLLGSAGNAEQFRESKELLLSGKLKVAVGTFKSVGQGIDIPNVMSGVCATPIGANRQFFGQVRGRICRVVPGKTVGHLYYLWDRLVFPEAGRNLASWNDGAVEIFDRQRRGWVAFR